MKIGTICCFICLVVGSIGGFYVAEHNSINSNNKESLCVKYKDFAISHIQDFFQKKLPEKYVLTITDLVRTMELHESPKLLGVDLYDDIKDSAICDSKLIAIVENKETKKDFNVEINIRYQLAKTVFPENYGYIIVADHDSYEALNNFAAQIKIGEKGSLLSAGSNDIHIEDILKIGDSYVDAKIVVNEFLKDKREFSWRFKDKTLRLSGELYDVVKMSEKIKYVMLVGDVDGIQCVLKNADQANNLKKGQKIKIQGIFSWWSLFNIQLNDCIIVEE